MKAIFAVILCLLAALILWVVGNNQQVKADNWKQQSPAEYQLADSACKLVVTQQDYSAVNHSLIMKVDCGGTTMTVLNTNTGTIQVLRSHELDDSGYLGFTALIQQGVSRADPCTILVARDAGSALASCR